MVLTKGTWHIVKGTWRGLAALGVGSWKWASANINAWRVLYWLVATATFRHSAIGFATLEHGNVWLGALSAMAVDAGMLLAAEALRRRVSAWMVIGLIVAAIGSVYSQLLYSVTNASAIDVAPGALWMGNAAVYGIYARVVALPVLLPLQCVVYAFASKEAPAPAPQGTTPASPDNSAPVTAPVLTDDAARLLAFYRRKPAATQREAATHVGKSRQWVSIERHKLEGLGLLPGRNGNHG